VPEIAAKDVAALRRATGAGMMDCKRALEESDGDLEAAMDWLRVKGLGKAGSLSEREATEGAVDARVVGNVGAVVELNCNTDFVAKGADFTGMLAAITDLVIAHGADDVESLPYEGGTVGDALKQLAAKLGENVTLGRAVRFETDGGLVDAYAHKTLKDLPASTGVLVELGGVDPADARAQEIAHEVALHVSFAAPAYLGRDDVPAAALDKERAVIEEKSRNEGIPEAKLAGAVQGRLNGFYKESVLLEQGSVRDPKVSIATLVAELGPEATVRRFARVKVGE
jgi:elongation factor Ts